MHKTFRIVLAVLLGLVFVFIVQFLITKLWNLFGISWGPDHLPFESSQQIGMLSSAFIAGTIGPCLSVVIAKRKVLIIAIVFLCIGLSIDVYAAVVPLKHVALWFRIAWVISVPIQVSLGIQLGRKLIAK